MEPITKLKLSITALGILLLGSACGTNPTIKYGNTSCDAPRTLDLEPGDVVDLMDIGGKNDFEITSNGKISVPGVSDRITNPDDVNYIIGDQNKPPYYVIKSTGAGNGDVQIERKCPIPPATPTPQPSATPFSYLGKGSGRLASLSSFHPDIRASKPVQVFRRG